MRAHQLSPPPAPPRNRSRTAGASAPGRPARLARIGALLAAALIAGSPIAGGATPAAAQTSDELREAQDRRDAVRDRQDDLAESLDVLSATDDQITAALDEIDATLAGAQTALDDAVAVADAAATELAEAEDALTEARRDVAVLRDAIREMAVAAFVHPPTADLVQSLKADSLSEALLGQVYLDARAQRDVDLLGLLDRAEATASRRAAEVADAAAAADRAVAAADAAVTALEDRRAEQQAFATDLHVRIDGALAESAALAELDAELSATIAAEQAAIIARIPPPTTPPTTVPPTTVPAPPTTEPVTIDPAAPTGPDTTDPADPTGTTSTTTTTQPDDEEDDTPAATRPYTEPPPLATVRGFTVHAGIADEVEAMLSAAAADGFVFGGGGYRSTQRQIELRIAHCGPTEYDIWHRPASSCRPPTAVPGRSLHEQGRALDLTFEGRLITSRSNAGFQWMAEHAASYGFRNLPSEPWHWSTTGG